MTKIIKIIIINVFSQPKQFDESELVNGLDECRDATAWSSWID